MTLQAVAADKKRADVVIRDGQQAGRSCATITLPLSSPVEVQARQRLANDCPYALCFKQITIEFAGGVLTLRGRVPTFYLKQMLQTWLRDLDNVKQINNRVDVVSASGLSSEPGAESVQ
jgi:hypothetical protein